MAVPIAIIIFITGVIVGPIAFSTGYEKGYHNAYSDYRNHRIETVIKSPRFKGWYNLHYGNIKKDNDNNIK